MASRLDETDRKATRNHRLTDVEKEANRLASTAHHRAKGCAGRR
ncbi:hypothetical protein [Streptomyces sp. NPDC005969]